ncbi:pyrroloquinoline quinone biosynthesis peptide chaperone PqqD [Gandjariella thermophila]|uniref:Pyrroloquinoline quinone biosynthesis protein PqqD n=1 Tax=Gandjariella thermophila TaxID=1931992 RepID=A0A4D4JE98_9PSEU|nr:pyrroloquinoline quinone biosynthesis peptide chaperone PqqD [Gandjariella thermophila]GDY32696.1 pyrroloquinoline quinone biosynthesis protein PqqD [Gandjariella thermophila]
MTTQVRSSSHPRLASHVRLTFDRMRGRHLLLAPESVSILNPTGAAILELCDGRRTVAEIVAALRDRYHRVAGDDVTHFLARLAARRYVEVGDD